MTWKNSRIFPRIKIEKFLWKNHLFEYYYGYDKLYNYPVLVKISDNNNSRVKKFAENEFKLKSQLSNYFLPDNLNVFNTKKNTVIIKEWFDYSTLKELSETQLKVQSIIDTALYLSYVYNYLYKYHSKAVIINSDAVKIYHINSEQRSVYIQDYSLLANVNDKNVFFKNQTSEFSSLDLTLKDLGEKIYVLITGIEFDYNNPILPSKINSSIPIKLEEVVKKLLLDNYFDKYISFNELFDDFLNLTAYTPEILENYWYKGELFDRKKENQKIRLSFKDTMKDNLSINLITGAHGVGKNTFGESYRKYFELHGGVSLKLNLNLNSSTAYEFNKLVRFLNLFIDQDDIKLTGFAQSNTEWVQINENQAAVFFDSENAKGKEVDLFFNVVKNLKIICRNFPLLIIVDNIQWINSDFYNFLKFIFEQKINIPLQIVGIFRDIENDSLSRTLSDFLFTKENSNIVELGVFSKEVTKILLKNSFLVDEINDEFLDIVYNITGGNPLFLFEIIDNIAKSKFIQIKNGAWNLKDFYDKFIQLHKEKNISDYQKSIYENIEKLSKIEKKILHAVSPIDSFSVDLIKFLTKIPEDQIYIATHKLILKQIIIKKPNGFSFQNKQTQDWFYKNLNTAVRKEYHNKIADFLSKNRKKTDSELQQIAKHYLKAESNLNARKIFLSLANKHLRNMQYRKSIELYEKSLKLTEINENKYLEILHGIANNYFRLGDKANFYKTMKEIFKSFNAVNPARKLLLENYTIQIQYFASKKEFNRAIQISEKALNLIDKIYTSAKTIASKKIPIYIDLSYMFLQMGSNTDLENYLSKLIQISETEDTLSNSQKFKLHWIISHLYYAQNKLKSAKKWIEKTSKNYASHVYDKNKGRFFHSAGDIYRSLFDYEKSKKYFREALYYSQKYMDTLNLAQSYACYGTTLLYEGHLKKSEANFLEAYSYFDKIKNPYRKCFIELILFLINLLKDDKKKIEEFENSIKSSLRENACNEWILFFYFLKIVQMILQNDFDSEKLNSMLNEIYRKKQDFPFEFVPYLLEAFMLISDKVNPKLRKKFFNYIKSFKKESSVKYSILEAFYIYYNKKNREEAYTHFLNAKYITVFDKIFSYFFIKEMFEEDETEFVNEIEELKNYFNSNCIRKLFYLIDENFSQNEDYHLYKKFYREKLSSVLNSETPRKAVIDIINIIAELVKGSNYFLYDITPDGNISKMEASQENFAPLNTIDIIDLIQKKLLESISDGIIIWSIITPSSNKITAVLYIETKTKLNFIETEKNSIIRFLLKTLGYILENIELTKIAQEKERLDDELKLATQLQKNLLPERIIFDDEVEFDYTYFPVKEMAGDYLDIFKIDDDRYGFLLGDVSGKGMASSIFMAMVKVNLHTNKKLNTDLLYIVESINELIMKEKAKNSYLYMTFVIMEYNVRTNMLKYVNAGHNHPLLFKFFDDEIIELESTGIPLGMLEDTSWEIKEIQLNENDIVMIFSDGVIDVMNDHEEFFGEERLEELFREHSSSSIQILKAEIIRTLFEFSRLGKRTDDLSLLFFKIKESDSV